MKNTIKTLGLVGLLAATGVGIVEGSKKTPFEMNANYRGYKTSKEDGIVMVYFGDREAGIVNEDKKFDTNKAYSAGGTYRVTGYTQLGTTYATNIAPISAKSN